MTAKPKVCAECRKREEGEMSDKPTCPTCGSDDPKLASGLCLSQSAMYGRPADPFHDAPAQEPNPGQTHYVGDRCAGGHQPEPERTGETVDGPYQCSGSDSHLSACGGTCGTMTDDPVDAEKALREARYWACRHNQDEASDWSCGKCIPCMATDRLARAAFEAGQRHIRDTERAVSQGWIGVGGFLPEPKWLPKSEEPR